jgi:hypothetical protein
VEERPSAASGKPTSEILCQQNAIMLTTLENQKHTHQFSSNSS